MRLLGLFAILATILAVFLGRAIAGRMGAFGFVILCHKTFPAFSLVVLEVDRKTQNSRGSRREMGRAKEPVAKQLCAVYRLTSPPLVYRVESDAPLHRR